MTPLSARWQELLTATLRLGASDLHLTSELPPYVRVDSELRTLNDEPISGTEIIELVNELLTEPQRETFARKQSLDMAFNAPGLARFRVNIYRQRGTAALAIRRLDDQFRSFEALNLPAQLESLTNFRDGLVLVTGPTGSGKSTTLAALIHQINIFRSAHIITIEDPIEYLHKNQSSLVHQRELYCDVPTYADALRAALREDPDVLLVGEMRDLETIRAVVTAAETGHLVFSTLHTCDAPGTISRMVSVFPAEEQTNVREQLSRSLRAVVTQRLLKTRGGRGRVPVCEVMRVTTGIANLIRTGQLQQITSAMQTGSEDGMLIAEQSLADLTTRGLLEREEALRWVRDEQVYDSRLQQTKQKKVAVGR